jgi:hypothetical protein
LPLIGRSTITASCRGRPVRPLTPTGCPAALPTLGASGSGTRRPRRRCRAELPTPDCHGGVTTLGAEGTTSL